MSHSLCKQRKKSLLWGETQLFTSLKTPWPTNSTEDKASHVLPTHRTVAQNKEFKEGFIRIVSLSVVQYSPYIALLLAQLFVSFCALTSCSTIKSPLPAAFIWKKRPVPENTHLCAMNTTPTEENLQTANGRQSSECCSITRYCRLKLPTGLLLCYILPMWKSILLVINYVLAQNSNWKKSFTRPIFLLLTKGRQKTEGLMPIRKNY